MGIACGVVFCAALVVGLVLLLVEGGLDQGDKIASIVSMVIAGISFPITVYTLFVSARQERQAITSDSPADRLDVFADILADAVRMQWESEEQVRRVHDPFPLPFRWSTADGELADHWQNINGSPDDETVLALAGQGDNVVGVFRRIPSGRLVVLGEAGAGKTILTSRFALTLLDERGRGTEEPVPVIFSLGSWDPGRASLRDWLTEQLITTYPVLGRPDGSGESVAARLLAAGGSCRCSTASTRSPKACAGKSSPVSTRVCGRVIGIC